MATKTNSNITLLNKGKIMCKKEKNLYKLLFLAIALNIAYWGFSEKYIHGGEITEGLAKGSVVSICFALAGILAASISIYYSRKG